MPRRDDSYYRAFPNRFLTSELRTEFTRAQWGIYRDLIDLLHANGGAIPDNPRYLDHQLFPDTPEDLDAVLGCKHITRQAGVIRHLVVDEDHEDLDQAREWGRDMNERRWGKKADPSRTPTRNPKRTPEVDPDRTPPDDIRRRAPSVNQSTTQPTKGTDSPLQGESVPARPAPEPGAAPAPSGGRRAPLPKAPPAPVRRADPAPDLPPPREIDWDAPLPADIDFDAPDRRDDT